MGGQPRTSSHMRYREGTDMVGSHRSDPSGGPFPVCCDRQVRSRRHEEWAGEQTPNEGASRHRFANSASCPVGDTENRALKRIEAEP